MGCSCSTKVEDLEMVNTTRTVPEGPVLLGKKSSSKLDLVLQDNTISCTGTNDNCYARCKVSLDASDIRDLDIRVLSYTCFNERTSEALGPGCCEITWKVQAGQDSVPTSIRLHIDESNLGTPKVAITSDGPMSTCKMTKINGELRQKWFYTGTIEGAHKINYFEMWVVQHKDWLPASLIREMSDGLYEMEAAIPDGEGSFKRVVFPAVQKHDIRYACSHKPLHAREHTLMLKVPEQDPSHAMLSVDGFDLDTRFFARPSPPACAPSRSLHLQVSQDRSQVLANMGHSALADFMQAEVRAVKHEWDPASDDDLKHSWVIQAGYFAQHVIQIEGSRLEEGYFVLAVDGEPLIAAHHHNLESGSDWECRFHLVGERSVELDLHEQSEGDSSENISCTMHKQHFFHECRVLVHETSAGKIAELFVDGINFAELPGLLVSEDEPLVDLTLDELNTCYGLRISLTDLYSFQQ